MKILQVTPVFYPHIGGLEKCVYNISRELVNRGNEVILYTPNFPKSESVEFKDGFLIHRIPVFFKIFEAPAALFFFHMLKEDCDLIHIHIPPIFGAFSSLILSRIKHVPIVLTFHNDTFGKNALQHLVEQVYKVILNKIVLRNVNMVTVPSQGYYSELNRSGLEKNKIIVIRNGITFKNKVEFDVEKMERKFNFSRKKIVLFVGALEKRKGIEFLIRSLPIVREKISEMKLVIVGNGSEKTHLQDLACNLGIKDYVNFKGQINDDQLYDMYEQCDVFVLPSLYESFGIVLLEAMSHRKPVVASRITGVTELVKTDYNGLLVEPKNIQQLAKAIIKVLSQENYSVQLGKNGKYFSKKFEWEEIIIEYENVFKECVKRYTKR
jgi:glycosyltransferase involved in cell wall biosynthesis